MKKRNLFLCSLIVIFLLFPLIEKCLEVKNKVEEEKKQEEYCNVSEETISKEEEYLGILEIPSIQLKRGFYSYTSKKNDVDKNIEVLTSCLPNSNCPFILASHSGSSSISFFKHLDKLQLEDTAILYYQNKSETYTLKRKESIIKNGMLTIKKENTNILILTTCNKENDNLQDVYYFY